MFCAQVLDDLRTRGGKVAENSRDIRFGNEAIEDCLRESVWIGWEGLLEDYARHLPVAGGRVFSV